MDNTSYILMAAVFLALFTAAGWLFALSRHRRQLAASSATIASLRQALDAIPIGVIITDGDDRISLINPIGVALTGFRPEEALGARLGEVLRIEEPAKTETAPLASLRKNVLLRRDGTRLLVQREQARIHDEKNGVSGHIIGFRDIGEEVAKLDQMRQNSRFLDTMIEAADIAYFRIDRQMNYLSGSSTKYWPVVDGTAIPIEQWLAPEDVAQLQAKWLALCSGKIAKFDQTYSVVTPEGRRYFEIRISQIQNELSGQSEYCGILYDITGIRQNEMRLLDNLQLLETAAENMPGVFFVKDVEDHFRYLLCNTQCVEVVGLSREQIIGHCDAEIFAGDPQRAERFMEADRSLIAGNTDIEIVEHFSGGSGGNRVLRTIKKIIHRADGGRLLLGMGQDITRQFELEQQQRQTIHSLNEYIASDRALYQVLTAIAVEPEFDNAVDAMLRRIGEFSGADHCSVFRYLDEQQTQTANIREWYREGVPPLHIWQPAADANEFTEWNRTLLEHRPVILSDLEKPPAGFEKVAEKLRGRAFRSVLACGIWVDDALYGFIAFHYSGAIKNFSECEIHTVNGIAQLYWLAFERLRQRTALEDSVSLQRQIVDNINLPVTILDLDYTVLAANPSALANAKQPRESFLGTKCYDTGCRQGAPPDFCPVRRTLQDGKPCRIEHDFLDKRLLASAQPIFDRDGKMKYILTVDVDITEITLQKKTLQTAMEQAQAADRAKSYFLATVSHELRTPLNAVIGFSELLQQDDLAPELRSEYLHSINFAGNALLNLINDVLDLSKLEADQVVLEPNRTDVAELVGEVAAVFGPRCKERGIDLLVDISGVRRILFIDNLRLRQILFNLLGNAVKFTEAGHVAIEAATAEEPAAGKASLTVRVSDTGIGISEEGQKNIFDPFVQDSVAPGKRRYEGTGLGLPIIRRLLAKMGGSIDFESESGKGSVFTVRIHGLDFESASASPHAPAIAEEASTPKRRRLLLVDDVPLNLRVLRGMFDKLGMESSSAASGAEALAILENDSRYDVILTDMWMPECSGAELAARLKRDPRLAPIPVYVVTADTQVTESELFAGILYKPVTMDTLRGFIRAIGA